MSKCIVFLVAIFLACGASASWWWPFGNSDENRLPRLSELMRTASDLAEDGYELASDGKTSEAIEKFRHALAELDRVERENPERVKAPEFATLRNKREYLKSSIESLQLSQVQENAKSVAVSDTTELEKRLAAEKAAKKSAAELAKTNAVVEAKAPLANPKKESVAAAQENGVEHAVPRTPREQAIADIAKGDYSAAELTIKQMLADKPNSPLALNLRASMEMKQGKVKEAEKTLDQAISNNPRNYFAYYNMALLLVERGDKSAAKRYYETGRSVGGPADASLEAMFKGAEE